MLWTFLLLELFSTKIFMSNISFDLQYASKDCVQRSKFCLYVGPLQALKSIMA